MSLTLLFSDLHLVPPGETVAGLDPWARLDAVLEIALRRHPDAERAVILGDLTHRGQADVYARLARRLEAFPLPLSLLLGNHDRREAFAASFPGYVDDTGFTQSVIDTGDLRLILCDTLDEAAPDLHSGVICDIRKAWLARALSDAGGRHIVALSHHPLHPVGFDGMDAIRLRNGDEIAQMLKDAGAAMIVSGHVHRTISGVSGGLPFATIKGTCHQMPLILGEGSDDLSNDEPGGYGVLLSTKAGVTLHAGDTTDAEVVLEPGNVFDHAR